MIQIKDIEVLLQLLGTTYHPRMMELLTYLDYEYQGMVIITCGYRMGDAGVHGQVPCRGLDIRSHVFEDPQGVADVINQDWIYDPERLDKQVCIYHDAGSGPHLHLQVHFNTVRRVGKSLGLAHT